MRVRALAVAAVGALIAAPLGGVAAQATEADLTDVLVVHGIPLGVAAEVDVFAGPAGSEVPDDAEPLIAGLAFQDITPVAVPPGSYRIEVRALDDNPDDAEPGARLVFDDLEVGTDPVTVAAQLDAGAAPVLAAYPDDLAPAAEGEGRVTVRHAAPVGPVDIFVDGVETFSDVANGQQGTADVPAGTYAVETQLDGQPVESLSAPALPVEAGVSYTAYAIALDDDFTEFGLLLDAEEIGTTDGGDTPTPTPSESETTPGDDESPVIPTAVPAGDGTSGWTGPLALPALLVLAVGAVLAVAVALVVRRGATQR